MARKYVNPNRDMADDAKVLLRASAILSERLGDRPPVNAARKLLLGTAMAIRNETAPAKQDKP